MTDEDTVGADVTLVRVAAHGRDPSQAVQHVLILTDGPPGTELPRRLPLGGAGIRVGRVAAGNDLVLPAPEVSRSHCTVSLVAGRAILADLGSTNGTFVEGEPVKDPVALSDNGQIRIGPFTLVYRSGTEEQLARAEALEGELRRARAYVEAVLPLPLEDGPVRANWRFVPSADLGGDGFGYGRLPGGRFCAWLIDVNGHGVGSALLAVSVMNVLRQPVPAGVGDGGDPSAVLAALNAMFPMDQQGGLCFSAWYGVFDPATRRLRYGSAGQHPAYLRAPADSTAAPLALATRNMMIGAVPDIPFRSAEAAVPPGSRLYLFSDGAFETTGLDGAQQDLHQFLPLLSEPPVPGLAEPERLLRAVHATSRPGPFEDDVSLVVVELD